MKSFIQNCLFIFIFGIFLSTVNAKGLAVTIIIVTIMALTAITVVHYVTLRPQPVVIIIRYHQLLHVVIHQVR